jgi:hypothetical protein
MDPSLCEAFFHQLSQTGRPLNGSFVESILRDGKFRLSAVKLTAEAAGSQHLYRIGHKFESMESGKLMIGTVVKVLDYGFQKRVELFKGVVSAIINKKFSGLTRQ